MTTDSSTTTDLDRLRAGLEETERLSREAIDEPWQVGREHIAHSDPARMLGWVRAARAIMAQYEHTLQMRDAGSATAPLEAYGLWLALRLIATHVYGEETAP